MDLMEELTAVSEVPEQREPHDDNKDYSLVVGTYGEGEGPDGLLTVAEFAAELTFKNFEAGQRGTEAVVKDAQIYNAIRAKRHPLPVVLVGDRVYLPKDAFQVWDERPVRGEGSGPAPSKRSDEDLIKLAGEAQKKLTKTQNRIEKLLTRRDKEAKLVERYTTQLVSRFGETEATAKVSAYVEANPDEKSEENE